MILEKVIDYLSQSDRVKDVLTSVKNGSKQLVTGLDGSAKTLMLSALEKKLQKPIVIVAPNALQANQWHEDLTGLIPADQLHVFPADEVVSMGMAVTSPEVHSERIQALEFLLSNKPGIVIVPLAGVKRLLPPPQSFMDSRFTLKVNEEVETATLTQRLIDMGYRREKMVATPGEFSIRGGIVDIYPLTEEYPIRMELFDVEIDSLRFFDVETQRSIENIQEIIILPATEQFFLTEWKQAALPKFNQTVEKVLADISDKEVAEKLEGTTNDVRLALANNEPYENLRFFAEFIYPEQTTLVHYLSEEAVLVLDDYSRILENEKQMSEEMVYWLEEKWEQGKLLPQQTFTVPFKNAVNKHVGATMYFSLFQKGMGNLRLDAVHHFRYRSMQQFFSQMELLHNEVHRWQQQNYAIVVAAPNAERAEAIQATFAEFEIKSTIATDKTVVHQTEVQIYTPALRSGFEIPEAKLAVITEKELFNRMTKKRTRRVNLTNAERLKSYNDLNPGDYVVHINHGIGQYLGMETMEVNGTHRDYLELRYKNDSKLYVPVDQLNLVQKYVASEGKTPKIHTLGGTEWTKTKQRVTKQVEDIADELIELYAEREAAKGHAFELDNDYQHEFEAAFPYTETEDQLRSSEEVKRDMEKEKPMDRLLVGDVGYGKTEVALRAVFKAVQEGKQAAFLVPTTVLAQQHYNSMLERFEGFPVEIGMLSRFRTQKQQKKTLDGLKTGKVDVVIGTHRLLSKDVEFNDLGLLIVDEEQRFGVKHKERLKRLKKDVDVLTLTATPIPRTLHMSMIGVRDLSVIETPPRNRYPVQTYVMEMNAGAIREAIEREMARDGQVFFLHNRVQTIEQRVATIQELVPDARIAYAHGQMPENKLEDVLFQFVEGEYDVLVTTTIIETGVDIPNVNTLIIEDADRMGLSQLYQLRGRVGRSDRVAYAYLMYQSNKILREESVKRLQSLREFTALGSGFKIAMRDLAIRGAGNLLGQQQSGFIDSVGYDLYTQLLREAVERKQNIKTSPRTQPELQLNVNAYIPDDYVADEFQKIDFYKRIQKMETEEDYLHLQDDFIDRFGDYPQEVADLLSVGLIKMYSEWALIETITQKEARRHTEITVTFSKEGSHILPGQEIFRALQDISVKVDVKNTEDQFKVIFYINKKIKDYLWLSYLEKFVKKIVDYREEVSKEIPDAEEEES